MNNVLLTEEDLKALLSDIREDKLPTTTGFCFGDNADEIYKEETMDWIERSLTYLEEGYDVYYTSSW